MLLCKFCRLHLPQVVAETVPSPAAARSISGMKPAIVLNMQSRNLRWGLNRFGLLLFSEFGVVVVSRSVLQLNWYTPVLECLIWLLFPHIPTPHSTCHPAPGSAADFQFLVDFSQYFWHSTKKTCNKSSINLDIRIKQSGLFLPKTEEVVKM